MVDGSNAALGGLQIGDVIRGTTARSKVIFAAPHPTHRPHPFGSAAPLRHPWLSQPATKHARCCTRVQKPDKHGAHFLLWAPLASTLLKTPQSADCAAKYINIIWKTVSVTQEDVKETRAGSGSRAKQDYWGALVLLNADGQSFDTVMAAINSSKCASCDVTLIVERKKGEPSKVSSSVSSVCKDLKQEPPKCLKCVSVVAPVGATSMLASILEFVTLDITPSAMPCMCAAWGPCDVYVYYIIEGH